MFGWFGNSTITESGGGSSFTQIGNKTFSGGWESATTNTTDWSNVTENTGSGLGSFTSILQGINTANSYDEQYRSLSDQADITKQNLWALQENYDKQKLKLDIDAYKTLGGIRARIGEGGSGLDLLQESAMNYGLESWELGTAFSYQLNQMFRQYKAQRKAANIAKSGRVGSWIGTGVAISLAPFTGGASLSYTDKFAQAGGSIGSAFH